MHIQMQIYILMVHSGQTFALEVEASNTTKNVKVKIQERTGIPLDQQQVNFAGKELNDQATISSYNIKEKDTLQLVELGSKFCMQLYKQYYYITDTFWTNKGQSIVTEADDCTYTCCFSRTHCYL